MKKKLLLSYLKLSGLDENTNKARLLDIGLTDKETHNNNLAEKISKKAVKQINELNKQLKRYYKGNIKFDFILDEKKIQIEDLIIDERKSTVIRKKFKTFLDEFDEEKRKLENKNS